MNRTVNGLEEAGFLTRVPADDDRRKVSIALTPAGLDVVEETVRRRDAWLESALGELTAAERTALERAAVIMRRLADR
jgi:DNA-binding MarR family transcriptional regulator